MTTCHQVAFTIITLEMMEVSLPELTVQCIIYNYLMDPNGSVHSNNMVIIIIVTTPSS